MIAVIVDISFSPFDTTSFVCNKTFQVHLSNLFTLPAIIILGFTSYYFSTNKNLGTVSLCCVGLERSAATVINL